MLRLARLIPSETADIRIGDHLPFSIDWPAHQGLNPQYWRISGQYELLMIGLNSETGAIVSVEHPARSRETWTQGNLWPTDTSREGHPVFELRDFPPDDPYFDAPDVATFDFLHSPGSIKLSWGRETTVVVDGRCRFGLDGAENLVAIGLDGLTTEEARIVRELVAEWAADRGRPGGPRRAP